MKYQDAEKVMSKLEDLMPDQEVSLVSIPEPDGPPDEPVERDYSVEAHLGMTADGELVTALGAIALECEVTPQVAIGRGTISGVNVTFR